jgi:hypothetical protein
MDPITSTIVWGVIWLFVGSFITAGIYLVGLAITALVFGSSNRASGVAGTGIGVLVSWLAASVWQIFVLIQVIIHVVHLIQLLTGQEPA